MSRPHIVAIPYPAQGHVIPLMELSQSLANHGIKVSFVNTEYNHKRIVKALAGESLIDLVSLPDGLEPWEDKSELEQLSEAMKWIMPEKLEELIEKINGGEGENVTCVMADHHIFWALEVAEKMNIKAVAFWPAATASLALVLSVPKYIDEGIVDNDGKISVTTLHFKQIKSVLSFHTSVSSNSLRRWGSFSSRLSIDLFVTI